MASAMRLEPELDLIQYYVNKISSISCQAKQKDLLLIGNDHRHPLKVMIYNTDKCFIHDEVRSLLSRVSVKGRYGTTHHLPISPSGLFYRVLGLLLIQWRRDLGLIRIKLRKKIDWRFKGSIDNIDDLLKYSIINYTPLSIRWNSIFYPAEGIVDLNSNSHREFPFIKHTRIAMPRHVVRPPDDRDDNRIPFSSILHLASYLYDQGWERVSIVSNQGYGTYLVKGDSKYASST